MKCPSCGSEVADGSTACPACGAPLTGSVQDASVSETEPPLPPPSPEYIPEPTVTPTAPPVASILQPVSTFDVFPAGVTPVPGTGQSTSNLGTLSLVLGIVGLLLSCVGCGGIISIAGGITGIMSLKTPGKKNGTIGLILSVLGLVIAIVVICGFGIYLVMSASSGTNQNGF